MFFYLLKGQKSFSRLLAILMIISVICLSFPASLFAIEKNQTIETSIESEAIQSTTDSEYTEPDEESNEQISPSPDPEQKLPLLSKTGSILGNGVFMKQGGNMPTFDETPQIFNPRPQPKADNKKKQQTDINDENYDDALSPLRMKLKGSSHKFDQSNLLFIDSQEINTIVDQTSINTKVEPKDEPKDETTVEPKDETTVEPKDETTVEPKDETDASINENSQNTGTSKDKTDSNSNTATKTPLDNTSQDTKTTDDQTNVSTVSTVSTNTTNDQSNTDTIEEVDLPLNDNKELKEPSEDLNGSTPATEKAPDDVTTLDANATKNQVDDSSEDSAYEPASKKSSDYPVKNKGGLYSAGFSKQAGKNFLKFTQGKASLVLSPLKASAVSAKIDQNTVLFQDIYPSTDFRYTAQQYYLKEDIIVNKYTGKSDYDFQFNLDNAVPQVKSNGEISFLDTSTDKAIFHMAKPFAVDDKGDRCDDIKLEISKEGLMKLTVDRDWLKSAAYPVIIDPTIYLENEVYASYINFSSTQGLDNWNYEEQLADQSFIPMTWNQSKSQWIGSDGLTYIDQYVQHSETNNSIRTWNAPHSGVVYIYDYLYGASNGSGDGINIKILRNDTQIWPSSDWEYLPDDFGLITLRNNLIIPVSAGDKIRFIVNKKDTAINDYLYYKQEIAYTNDYYQTLENYGSTQGFRNWYYEERRPDGIYYPLTWDSGNSQWVGTSGNIVSNSWQLPGINDAVRTWKAPYSGLVYLTGHVYKIDTAGGDGVIFSVYINDTLYTQYNLSYDKSKGYFFGGDIPVNCGDKIRLVVNQNANSQNDKTGLDATIANYQLHNVNGEQSYWNYVKTDLGGGWNSAVNTFNKNLVISKQIWDVPGRGYSLNETLTYNSADKRGGPLGVGWHLGSDITLIEEKDGNVVLNAGDGSINVFTNNGSGGYNAPAGVYLTMQKLGAGNYKVTDKKYNVMTFQTNKISNIADATGNITTYTYENGRLSMVKDASGRALYYTYNANNKLTIIYDKNLNRYKFYYNHPGDNNYLSEITDRYYNRTYLSPRIPSNSNNFIFTDPLNNVTTFNGGDQIAYINDARTNGTNVYKTTFSSGMLDNLIVTTVTDPGSRVNTYYHNPNTGNLTKFVDPLNNTWQYTWYNNNQTSVQDAKGATLYTHDGNGNVLTKTTTVDSNSANNITETMTYDAKNQLTKVVDGSGRTTNYQYDVKGNLLNTSNPDLKESNGKLYDQYGNVLQSSAVVSTNHNLLKNGSFETGGLSGNGDLSNWSRVMGNATVTTPKWESNKHGNYALKMSSNTQTTDWYYQRVTGITYGDKLTLKTDIDVSGVQNYGGIEGATILLDYGNGYWTSWSTWGTGTNELLVTSQAANNYVDVYVGFKTTNGTAWFDGIQLENAGASSDGFMSSAFSSVENGDFEMGSSNWYSDSGVPAAITSEAAYKGAYSAKITGSTSIFQDVPVYSSVYYNEPLTFTGKIKTVNVSGTGAYYKIAYYNSSGQFLSAVQTGYVMGTNDFTHLTCVASAPTGAYYARVTGMLQGSGTAYFDSVKMIPRNTTKYTYESRGNYVTVSEDALGKMRYQTTISSTGTLTSSTDEMSNKSTYKYDLIERLSQVTDHNQKSAYYQYDGDDNLIYTRDPMSASGADHTYKTGFTPNKLNQLSTLTDPLNRSTGIAYDNSSNLTSVTLPNSLVMNYVYDNANRMTKKTLDGGKYFDFSYDGANNLTGVTDQENKNYSYTYDGAKRVTSSTDTFGYTQSYLWDKSNNVTEATGSNTGTVSYVYGSDKRLVAVRLPDGNIISYNYNENGRVFQVRNPGTDHGKLNHRNVWYDANGRCNKITDAGGPVVSYHYYSNGTIYAIQRSNGGDSFSYDGLRRLISWSDGSNSEIYNYDAAGNLTTKGSKAFTYNNANQITNTGFSYDNNGNQTSDGTYNYLYNAENKLIQVNKVADNSLVATYTYNHNELRKSKTVGGVITNYDWDDFGRLVRESDAGGNTIASYYYDDKGNLVGLKKGGQTYIYHTNLRGDIVSVTDYEGNWVAQYSYDPWGKQISYSGTLVQPFRYAGYYTDDETGSYYLKTRYYSPNQGRFLTKDAYKYINIKNPQTLNLYAYANNNPVSMVDPSGTLAMYTDDNGDVHIILHPGDKIQIKAKVKNDRNRSKESNDVIPNQGNSSNSYSTDSDESNSSWQIWSSNVWTKVKSLLNVDEPYEIETPTMIMGTRSQ